MGAGHWNDIEGRQIHILYFQVDWLYLRVAPCGKEHKRRHRPIVVGAYAQWPVSNSVRKEAMDAKVMATNLKDKVDEIYFLATSAAKSIN